MTHSILRRLFGAEQQLAKRAWPQIRPQLELLEDRVLLSTVHVGSKPGEFPTIQSAVLAANPGDTIKVDPGTYKEQVIIDTNSRGATLNNLKLEGSGQSSTFIQLPPTAPPSQTTAILEISIAQKVTVNGFTIEGPGNTPFASIGYGVEVDHGGSAIITNNHITHIRDNPLSGDQNGVGILVGRQSQGTTGSAMISHNIIDDYQKGGIVVDNTGSSAMIDHNTITGVGSTPLIAQNGIQISRGATANVTSNNVSQNLYAAASPTGDESTGILLFQPGAVMVAGNMLSHNDVGIYSLAASAPKIGNNNVSFSTFNGIVLDATTRAQVNNNTTDNNGSGGSGDGGIAVIDTSMNNTVNGNMSNNNDGDGIFADSTTMGNVFSNNTMRGNSIWDAEDQSHGTGTAGTANTWKGNHGGTSNPPGLVS